MAAEASVLLIACGALTREITAIRRLGGWDHVEVRCLPPELHNRPEEIPDAVRRLIEQDGREWAEILVAYADCGTGGRLDAALSEYGARRLPGAHCYELFAGAESFAALTEAEPRTFYLTDFLVRHFERLVVRGLGLDRHPELRDLYFGNYRRVVYLAQTQSAELEARAREGAQRLGLSFEREFTGLDPLARTLAVTEASSRAKTESPWSG